MIPTLSRVPYPVRHDRIVIGHNAGGEEIKLLKEHLDKHVLFIGPTRGGKTREMGWFFRCIAEFPSTAIAVIDPKGDLARLTYDLAIQYGHGKRIVPFDPADNH